MDLQLSKKVVIVTGGSKGIGEAISRQFSIEGATVCIFTRDQESGQNLAHELTEKGGQSRFYSMDMTDELAVIEAVQQVLLEFGKIDVVVNNAATNDAVGLRHGVAQFRNSLERNIVQVYSLIHLTLDALIESKGCIVNIGSKCSTTGQGGTSGYAASKGAMAALTREWAVDLLHYGIRVNEVIPAEVMTPQYENWIQSTSNPKEVVEDLNRLIPLGQRTTTAEEIANAVVFIASPRSSHTTGQRWYVDGGYVHLDRACTQKASHLKKS